MISDNVAIRRANFLVDLIQITYETCLQDLLGGTGWGP